MNMFFLNLKKNTYSKKYFAMFFTWYWIEEE
jgi:hypothetical protein